MTGGQEWLIGAIDHGTTSSRMIIFDGQGQMVCSAQRPIRLHSPHEGWAEHDPFEVIEKMNECLEECARQLKEKGLLHCLKSIGLAVHRESTLAFYPDTNKPASNIILWMDTRTKDIVQDCRQHEKLLTSLTGLKMSTYFSAFKMKWILQHLKLERPVQFATMDSWILRHLTGQYKIDITNASRTMLMNLEQRQWDDRLLDVFGLCRHQLPTICPSIHNYGVIKEGLLSGIPVTAVFGDQQASLLGLQCAALGDAKCTLGTGAFILANTGDQIVDSSHFISTIVANGSYAVEAPIAMASSGLDWVQQLISCNHSSASEGVMFVPAVAGLLAPFWRPDARASFHNLSLRTTASNMLAAVMEAIVFSITHCLELLRDSNGISIKSLKIDGGLSNSGRLLQMIADCSQIQVQSPLTKECTALGAALGSAQGMHLNMALTTQQYQTISPKPNEQLQQSYEKWKKLMMTTAPHSL